MKVSRWTPTSNRRAGAESVVEADSDSGESMKNCQIAETGSAGQTARMPSAQAPISLAEAAAVHSGCTDIVESGSASLHHLAMTDLAAVWQMVDLTVAVLEPV